MKEDCFPPDSRIQQDGEVVRPEDVTFRSFEVEYPNIQVVRGVRKAAYISLGWVFVVLATLGVILPLLPTTPFLLLASYFFIRSSRRLHGWLLRNRVFGPLIRDWQERGGVRPSVKFTALVVVPFVIGSSIYLGQLSSRLIIVLCVLGAVGMTVVICLPIAKEQERGLDITHPDGKFVSSVSTPNSTENQRDIHQRYQSVRRNGE